MTPLQRLPDWPARLHAFVDRVKAEPFSWDGLDCVRGFASGAVEAVTGVDFAAPHAGGYATAAEARQLLRQLGHASPADLAASLLPEIFVCEAQLGDIVAIPSDGPFGWTLGIVNGERVLVMREDGLGTCDLFAATRAFRVG